MQIADFTIPGQSGGEPVQAPSGIPDQLKGGFDTSGKALIQLGINWLFIIAALLTVLFMIYAGIQWITSRGDPSRIAAAKSRLFYAIIGLVVVSLAFFIVRVVITVLGGDSSYFFNFGNLGAPTSTP